MGNLRGSVSLVLVDPTGSLQQRLETLGYSDIHITCHTNSLEQALQALPARQFDLLLVNLQTPAEATETLLRSVRDLRPGLPVLVHTQSEDSAAALRLLRTGIHGLISATIDTPSLLLAIRSVASGALWFSPSYTDSFVSVMRSNNEMTPKHRGSDDIRQLLTQRENDVLNLIARGLTNEQIARQLNLGVETVKTHVRRIMDKTANRSRRDLMDKVLNAETAAGALPPNAFHQGVR